MASEPGDTNIFSLTMLQQIIDHIENNLYEELTPAAIAAHFFVSVSSLSSLFKIVCGITIMEYIRNRRLTLAAWELSSSDTPVIELAFKYGYETPEAFTKAFSRFHGFPPSFVRRGFPIEKTFLPLQVRAVIRGGWDHPDLTKSDHAGQDRRFPFPYNTFIRDKGEYKMRDQEIKFQLDTSTMQFKREWNVLCSVAEELLQARIPFKVDGKTMIFAHGLEIPLDKICLTFQWKEEEAIKYFFHYNREVKQTGNGFKYFDAIYEGMTIRCMFYGGCPDADTDEFLYRNTDLVQIDHLVIPVQSLQFYYENAEKNTMHYKIVEEWLGRQENYRTRNKKAWEYSAYEFWVRNSGTPAERAKKDLQDPKGMLKKYAGYFDSCKGVRIANICGSCGKKAVPLAILGADVTVFDISEDNRKYALEVAEAANVRIDYEVCDVLEIKLEQYGSYFDVVFMEGGVLHYFHDINDFMQIMYALLKQGGKIICSDFHPFTKIADILELEQPAVSYFAKEIFEGEMAHARFFEEPIRSRMPKCLYRKYTLSEIINSVIGCGFMLRRFDEHPAWTNEKVPGEFTIVAIKDQ